MVSVWDWSARYCTYRWERPSLLDLLAVRFQINFWLDGWGSTSPLEIGPMHLSVEGLCPWDWSYPVLQYLREWPTPTVISSLSQVLSLNTNQQTNHWRMRLHTPWYERWPLHYHCTQVLSLNTNQPTNKPTIDGWGCTLPGTSLNSQPDWLLQWYFGFQSQIPYWEATVGASCRCQTRPKIAQSLDRFHIDARSTSLAERRIKSEV